MGTWLRLVCLLYVQNSLMSLVKAMRTQQYDMRSGARVSSNFSRVYSKTGKSALSDGSGVIHFQMEITACSHSLNAGGGSISSVALGGVVNLALRSDPSNWDNGTTPLPVTPHVLLRFGPYVRMTMSHHAFGGISLLKCLRIRQLPPRTTDYDIWAPVEGTESLFGNVFLRVVGTRSRPPQVTEFRWAPSRQFLPQRLQAWQGQQEHKLKQAGDMVNVFTGFLTEVSAEQSLQYARLLEPMILQLTSDDVIRTREVLVESICLQLETIASAEPARMILVRSLCCLAGPSAYEEMRAAEAAKDLASQSGDSIPLLLRARQVCGAPKLKPHIAHVCSAVKTRALRLVEQADLVCAHLAPTLQAMNSEINLGHCSKWGLARNMKNAREGKPPLRVLVVGAGPIGLMTAIMALLSGVAHGAHVDVTVLEKQNELGSRTNVLKFAGISRALLEVLGGLGVMPVAQKNILDTQDLGSISIGQVQRALWKIARVIGIKVDRMKEFLAYCPGAEGWYAVAKDVTQTALTDWDTVDAVEWAFGTADAKDSYSANVEELGRTWLQDVCSKRTESRFRIYNFDVIVAGEGTKSRVRDQGKFFSEGFDPQNLLMVQELEARGIPLRINAHTNSSLRNYEVFGLTFNYRARDSRHNDKSTCVVDSRSNPEPGNTRYPPGTAFNFVTEHWCYFGRLMYKDAPRDYELMKRIMKDPDNRDFSSMKSSELQKVLVKEFGISSKQFLYGEDHRPDIHVFRVGGRTVMSNDDAAYVQVSDKGRPMLLVLVGDAYAPGFFPLGNLLGGWMSFHFARLSYMEKPQSEEGPGGIGKLAESMGEDRLKMRAFREWASRYNTIVKTSVTSCSFLFQKSQQWLNKMFAMVQNVDARHVLDTRYWHDPLLVELNRTLAEVATHWQFIRRI